MSTADAFRLLGVSAGKRIRTPKYSEFGQMLKDLREGRDLELETVIRKVEKHGVRLDRSTLQGWEYGWSGSPDPLRLLALANVYGVPLRHLLLALASARKIDVETATLFRHAIREGDAPISKGGADAETEARVQQALIERNDRDERLSAEVADIVERLMQVNEALRTEAQTPQRRAARRRRAARKSG